MREVWPVVVVGSGNAALCAGIAALEAGCQVLMIEKGDESLAGGNSKYTAGAMRFAYNSGADLMELLEDPHDPRLANAEFGSYDTKAFRQDLSDFNGGRPISREQEILIDRSYATIRWLASHGIKFEPIWDRQAYLKNGKHVFWGGLTLAAHDEGVGLVNAQLRRFLDLGGIIKFGCDATGLERNAAGHFTIQTRGDNAVTIMAKSVVLACGGFEANSALREKYLGSVWTGAVVRGTPHNTGSGLEMAMSLNARMHGYFAGCHATPMDLYTPPFGNLDLPPLERKNYRKICYFLGVMLNADGKRFVNEGANFRNYTYAQFGRAVLNQPGSFAWQIFDKKVDDLLYEEYRSSYARYVEADTLETLVEKLDGITDKAAALATLNAYNAAVDTTRPFDPTTLDGKGTIGLDLPKSHWAQRLDTAPFRAYPVTGGITFTYGGVEVADDGSVLDHDGSAIEGLFACGEMVGGVFYEGYPGGAGLTSGAVFGRMAGAGAAKHLARTQHPAGLTDKA